MSKITQHRFVFVLITSCLMIGVLSGCSIISTPKTSPDNVHTSFLTALQNNDRTKLLALSHDETYKTENADNRLEKIRYEMSSTNPRTGGLLSNIEVVSFSAEGEGRRGISRWHYAKRTICHDALLAQTDKGWRVIAWYELAQCPTS